MKKTIILIATVLTCLQLSAQKKSSYLVTKNDKKVTTVAWTETETPSGLIIDVVTPGVQHTNLTCDNTGKSSKFHVITENGKNDYTVERKGDVYTIAGKVDGKEGVKKEMKSEGYPWYQMINFSAGKILSAKNKSIKYECIRPANGKITTMAVSIVGETEMNGHKVYDVKAATTGIIAGLWSCHYFIDRSTGQFIAYQGVEGPAGTPVTKWTLQ